MLGVSKCCRRHRRALAVVSLLLAAAVFAGIWRHDWCRLRETPQHPALRLDRTAVDFGRVVPGSELCAEFRLTNAGQKPLRVTELRTSCGCAPAAIDRAEILAQESALLKVRFHVPMHPGDVAHRVFFETNDPGHAEVALRLHALAQWDMEANPSAIYVPTIALGDEAEYQIELLSTAGTPIGVKEAEVSAPGVRLSQIGSDLRRVRFVVHVEPKETGHFRGAIQFTTTSKQRPRIVVPVQGECVGPIICRPRALVLGMVAPGCTRSARLVVQSRAEDPVIGSLEVSDPAWKIVDWEMSRKGGEAVLLSLILGVPAGAGHSRTSLVVRGNGWKSPIHVPVSAFVCAGENMEGDGTP